MANQEVPRVKTSVSEAELTRAFMDTAKELFGVELSKSQLAILIAQNNLETGGRQAMWNFNIGNITHNPSVDSFDYFVSGDKTKDKAGNWVPIKLKFRSYPTLHDAAKDYLRNLKNRGGGKVWNSILQADPAGFSKALKDTKYYEADEKDYTRGMIAGVKAFNKKDSYENAVAGNFSATNVAAPSTGIMGKIDTLLNQFLKAIAETQHNKLVK